MQINSQTLRTLYTSFSTAYQGGFSAVAPLYQRIAQVVPSTTRENQYGWMGAFPTMREWIGERVVQNISTADYTIRNKSFEVTIGVNRDDIKDDNLGVYGSMFQDLGREAATQPDRLVWSLLKSGFATPCYDKQYFFDTDHPVLDAAGKPQSVSNFQGGSADAWYLLDVSRVIKPIVFQTREPFTLTRKDAPDDDNVFNRKEYVYGVDGRCNAGFGFWQLAAASKQALTPDNYAALRAGMSGLKKDGGEPLGVMPNLLVVPPSLEGAARKLLTNEMVDGSSNPWKGTAELLVVPWLA